MSSSNKPIWIVLAVASAMGIAAAIYVVQLIGQSSDERIITGQVDEWGQTWAASRACLVGAEPAFSRGSHAYLVHEATRGLDMDALKSCDAHIRKLRRPGEESSANVEFEAAWGPVREATKELAAAYVLTLDPVSRRYAQRRARLAAAIDSLDTAYAELRAAAGLEPALPPGAGEPAELGAGTVIAVDGASVEPGFMDRVGSSLVMDSGAGNGRDLRNLVVVRGPERIDSYPVGRDLIRAADDAAWGIWFARTDDNAFEMRAGPLTPEGQPDGDGVVVMFTTDPRQQLLPRSVLGQGQTRAIIYEIAEDVSVALGNGKPLAPDVLGVYLVRSLDGGATWSDPVRLTGKLAYASSDLGRRRFDMAWQDDSGALRWLGLRADRLDPLPQPRRLFDIGDATPQLEHCVAENASWWLQERVLLFHTAGDSPGRVVERGTSPEPAGLVGCLDDRALLGVGTEHGEVLHQCTARGCEPLMEVLLGVQVAYAAVLGKKRGPVALTQAGPMLVLWRPGKEPAGFLAEDGHVLRTALEWDGELHAIMAAGDELRIVAVPWP